MADSWQQFCHRNVLSLAEVDMFLAVDNSAIYSRFWTQCNPSAAPCSTNRLRAHTFYLLKFWKKMFLSGTRKTSWGHKCWSPVARALLTYVITGCFFYGFPEHSYFIAYETRIIVTSRDFCAAERDDKETLECFWAVASLWPDNCDV